MLSKKIIEEIGKKISGMAISGPAKDIEKNIRALLSSALSRLDLVSREEFNLQQEICVHTREALQDMSMRLNRLEAKLKLPKSAKTSSTRKSRALKKTQPKTPTRSLKKDGST